MSSTNAGSIYYDVEMDVKGLLSAQQQVNARLDSMERGFNSTSKAVEGTERSFSSLTKISVALSAAMSVKQITEYATAWVDVNNKLANAVKTNESLAEVTSRVFDIAQSTKSDLQSTAALYGTLERSTRSLGLSSNDLSSVIKTVNEGLVLSGATTQEAAGATLQLSQALASGALRGDEFNSVSENGSRLAQALADSLGVNIGQLKVMAGQGKLTSDVVINGLLSQGATIAQEFNNHTTTLAQSLQIAGNNLTKFFGENTTVNSFLSAAGSGIVMLSEHVGALSSVLTAGALIMGSRYVSALAMSASASIKGAIATVQQTKATADAAQASVLRAQAEVTKAATIKYSASVEVAAAAAQARSATTADEAALAQGRLSAARLAMIDATVAETAATNELTAAQKSSATASAAAGGIVKTALGGAMSLVGGPVGVIALAATALYMWHQNAEQAKKSANDLADSVGDLGRQFKTMSDTQLSATIAKLNQSLPSLTEQSNDAEIAFKNATYRVNKLQEGIDKYGLSSTIGKNNAAAMQGALDNQSEAAANLDDAQRRLSQTQSLINLGRAQLNGTMQQGLDLLSRENTQVGVADGLYRKFGQTLNIAAQAKQNFNSQSLTMQRPPDAEGYLKQLNDENDLLAIQDLRQRAIAKGRLDFQNKIASNKQEDPNYLNSTKYKADIQLAGELAGKYYDEQKADSARQKQQKAGVTTANQQARAEESVTQKLDQLRQQSDLNAVSSQNLTLEQTKLRAEMSLGKNATAAQREEAAKYAEAIWQQAAAMKARSLIPEIAENDDYRDKQAQLDLLKNQKDSQGKLLLSEQQHNEQSEKLAQQHLVNMQKIRAQEQTNNPIASARAEVDPIQQLTNQYNQQKALSQQYQSEELAILQAANAKRLINDQQYQSAKATTENQYRMLRTAADNQYDQQRTAAEWQLLSQQGLGYQTLTSAVDAFSQSAGSALTSVITGASSGKEAMEQLGQAILSSVVNTLAQAAVQALIVKPLLEAFGVTAESSLGASTAAAGESYAAWAPAAVAASIATLGSAAGIGLASYAGATLAGTTIGKGRKNGGPVSSGGVYPVGESNLPEFLQTSNGLFMIPGDNGRVFSNKDVTSGAPTIPKASTGSEYLKSSSSQGGVASDTSKGGTSSGIKVTHVVNNYASGVSVQNQTTQNGNQVIIETLLTDMENGGPVSSSMQSTFGLSRKATGDY
ncbi:tape measure protein [Rosenbergiella epipactidis]|uniref:tape measure protein n=1 Tax=Rosenbergiella epipactidis TaxID=1544694 RepID=UPI001F4D3FFE|nr:tape measure protein [Rosenbergiella epipactidis]